MSVRDALSDDFHFFVTRFLLDRLGVAISLLGSSGLSAGPAITFPVQSNRELWEGHAGALSKISQPRDNGQVAKPSASRRGRRVLVRARFRPEDVGFLAAANGVAASRRSF